MGKSINTVHVSTKKLRWYRKNISVVQATGEKNLYSSGAARILYRHLEQELSALDEPGVMVLDFRDIYVTDSSSLLASVGKLLSWNLDNGWLKAVIITNIRKNNSDALDMACKSWPMLPSSHGKRILTIASRLEDGIWEILGELNETEMLLWNISKEGEISLDEFVSRSNLQRDIVLSNIQVLIDNRLLWINEQDELVYITPTQALLLNRDKAFKPLNINNKTISVLFLAADPTDSSRLRLGEEFRAIQEKLRLAQLRDRFTLALPQLSVRPADISQALLDAQPQIVHFSGHGASTGALHFENQVGQTHLVKPDALAALFEQFANQVYCVILNACYSVAQAKAIGKHIKFVIGMNRAISDKAAIAFAIGFYQGLGAGRTIEDAYKLGCVQIRLLGTPEHLTPVFIKKESDRP